jgi:hypothetical protein
MTNHCQSCGTAVVWRKSAQTGRVAPIEADPNPAGNCYVNDDGTYTVGPCDAPGSPRYLNHFATCPQAARWRRKSSR